MRRIATLCALLSALCTLFAGIAATTSARPPSQHDRASRSAAARWRPLAKKSRRHGRKSHASAKAANSLGSRNPDPMMFGDATIESSLDHNSAGLAEAFPFINQKTGTATSISVYVGTRNKATTLMAALYSDANGGPGKQIAAGSMTTPRVGAWNTLLVASVGVTSGATYWLAILGKGGALYFRDRSSGACASQNSASSSLTNLPSTWTGGRHWDTCPISASVNGIEAASSSTVALLPPTTPALLAPTNTAPPAISGTPTQGQTLTTSDGSWNNLPTSFSYQWEDCDSAGASCTGITGATANSYTLTANDVGHTIRATVTASNLLGSGTATSDATSTVAQLAPASTALPSISGTATQGQTLTTSNGSWTNNPSSFAYKWQDCDSSGASCSTITGATANSYTLTANDVGHTLRATITATNAGGSGSATSNQTTTVASSAPSAPASTALPSISGTATQGQTLTTSNGSWTNNPSSFAYKWQDCDSSGASCSTITGATANSYTLTANDVGHTLRATITATNAGGSGSATSNQTTTVASSAPSAPASTALPSISGTATQGQTLTTSNGSWTNNPSSFAYKWQDCDSSGASCSTITGATANSYTLTANDVGHTLRATITATNAGGSGSATSNQTTTVASSGGGSSNAPPNLAQPSISGSLEQGQVLTTTNGSWSNSPTSFSYQWEDCNLQGMSCSLISGATNSTYTIQAADKGSSIRSIVTASNGSGSSSMYSGATGIATATCTQTFTSSNAGSSPYAGSNVNSALKGASAGSVFCLSGNVGEIDLYNNPAGRVYIEPAPSASATAYFNVNGNAGGASNITIQGLTGSFTFYCSNGPSGCNITGDQFLNNAMNGKSVVRDMPGNTSIYIARNTFADCGSACSGGLDAGIETADAYAQTCPNGVTIAHNTVNNINGDGIDDSSSCGTQILSNIIQNITQNGGNCSSHCDGWQETGSGKNIAVDGNLYLNDSDCWADLPNSQGQNLTITNNVCTTASGDSSFWAQFTSAGMTFKHNTVVSKSGCEAGNALGGAASNLVFTDNIQESTCTMNSGQSAPGSSENYNLCPSGTNFSCGGGGHDATGSPAMTGGSSPAVWTQFQLNASFPRTQRGRRRDRHGRLLVLLQRRVDDLAVWQDPRAHRLSSSRSHEKQEGVRPGGSSILPGGTVCD